MLPAPGPAEFSRWLCCDSKASLPRSSHAPHLAISGLWGSGGGALLPGMSKQTHTPRLQKFVLIFISGRCQEEPGVSVVVLSRAMALGGMGPVSPLDGRQFMIPPLWSENEIGR